MAASAIVYVVDDDEDVRNALARLADVGRLERRSIQSPRAFLDGFDRAACACLVLDLAMPGVDGLELQRMLEREGVTLPIVFLTGSRRCRVQRAGDEARRDGFPAEAGRRRGPPRGGCAGLGQGAGAARAGEGAAPARRRHRGADAARAAGARGIVAGRLNKQIAGDLGIAEKTIKYHRGNLMRK